METIKNTEINRLLKFKISAKTARLIGRENVANADGAIIELIKNSYDADATICVVYFDSESNIHIVDNGAGMTESIIIDHWMTIGTDFKESESITNSGRVRNGAKGIGRFSLDRLGSSCNLITKSFDEDSTLNWAVNWNDFEDESVKSIDQIDAILKSVSASDFSENIQKLSNNIGLNFKEDDFISGTYITISGLRDDWNQHNISSLFKNLSNLIPPKEIESNFKLYVFSSNDVANSDTLGQVAQSNFDDYDYKLVAEVADDGKISINVFREEYDVNKVDPDVFKQEGMRSFPFDYNTFLNKQYTLNYSSEEFQKFDYSKIGPFRFTFYYLKREVRGKIDSDRFCYRPINEKIRSNWLATNGGIKVFRDGFRVRPYGEVGGYGFDWLNLSDRHQKSTAGIASKTKSWKVRETNVSGFLEISRINNPNLFDKANREGIIENDAYKQLKSFLVKIIEVFEKDKITLSIALNDAYVLKNDYPDLEEVIDGLKSRYKGKNKDDSSNKEVDYLLQKNEKLEDIIVELVTELKILRVLASSGLMVAAFVHELNSIKSHLSHRTKALRKILSNYISSESVVNQPDYNNPFTFVDRIEKQDNKLINWMKFALESIRPDKRKRSIINLNVYFSQLKTHWDGHFKSRFIDFRIVSTYEIPVNLKCFEIDLDTVFNNLITNSIEAFSLKNAPETREITVEYFIKGDVLFINYKDSGPGLASHIKDPNVIFDVHFSTKQNPTTGEEVGTGIGMWLVKSVVDELRGKVTVQNIRPNFEINFEIPANLGRAKK